MIVGHQDALVDGGRLVGFCDWDIAGATIGRNGRTATSSNGEISATFGRGQLTADARVTFSPQVRQVRR